MNNEREQQISEIENQIKALPLEAQNAVAWIIKNIEAIEQLTQAEKISEAKAKCYIEKAQEENDFFLLALILFKQTKSF